MTVYKMFKIHAGHQRFQMIAVRHVPRDQQRKAQETQTCMEIKHNLKGVSEVFDSIAGTILASSEPLWFHTMSQLHKLPNFCLRHRIHQVLVQRSNLSIQGMVC